jgi:hypothetical protein
VIGDPPSETITPPKKAGEVVELTVVIIGTPVFGKSGSLVFSLEQLVVNNKSNPIINWQVQILM